MTVYCDQLTVRIALAVAAHRLSGEYARGAKVVVLDAPVRGPLSRLGAVLLTILGFEVSEASFFAGHLRAASGEGIPVVARKAAFTLADLGGRMLVEESPVLRAFNARCGRETLRLRIAKQMWLPAEGVMLRALTVEALSSRDAAIPPTLFVAWPAALPRALSTRLPTSVRVLIAGQRHAGWKTGRLSAILWACRQWVRRMTAGAPPGHPQPPDKGPALLVPQEDDLSLDRSFRCQPHWWTPDAADFRTIVLRLGQTFEINLSADDRASARLEVVELADVAAASGDGPIVRELWRSFVRLAIRALIAPTAAEAFAANEAARLATTARELARFCLARGVRAFLTCENYSLHADAMQIIAAPLDIRTLSYQYANMPNPSLPMITTADCLISFAPMFNDRFCWPGFKPPQFIEAGYVYDGSFVLVAERARERRARLHAAGVRFIIGFFDESVQRDKYGLVNADDYATELMVLFDLVHRDESVGLVLKTQFHQNLRAASPRLAGPLERVLSTGRVELPSNGRHRNSVLPGEVARSSDITLGHAFGGTASLEAALAGCRSVLINSCGLQTKADPLYARVDITAASVAEACRAIEDYRRGTRPAFGDWAPILREFDPYQDGQSVRRFRGVLQEALCSGPARR